MHSDLISSLRNAARHELLRGLVVWFALLIAARAQTGGPLAAPTGVTASDGAYANKIAVTWDPVPGAKTYRIFRGAVNNVASATAIGATSSWVFWDTTAAAGQTSFYWVRAETPATQSAFSASDSGSRGNANGPGTPTARLEPPPEPAGNPVTLAKVALGKALFWDEQLSTTNTVACGTCHVPEKGGVDLRAVLGSGRARNAGPDGVLGTADDVTGSPGVPLMDANGRYVWDALKGFGEQVTGRSARPSIGAAYFSELFWDGRASGVFRDPVTNAVVLPAGGALESQSVGPIVNSAEMAAPGRTWDDVTAKLATAWPLALASDVPGGLARWIGTRSYPELFEDAFGTREITPARIAFALASYERTLFADRTPFDEANALLRARPAAAQRGLGVFNGETCVTCHAGVTFSDGLPHHIGVRPTNAPEDGGRFNVTGLAADRGKFITPSLRNVALRGPYMHTGTIASLDQVLRFYDRGGDFPSAANEIRGINLNAQERSDLAAFLDTLTDPRLPARVYPFDRPTLFTESGRLPVAAGAGVAGSGGVPRASAIEPPLLGNARFTFALQGGLGGATAVLVVDRADPPTNRIPGATEVVGRFVVTLGGAGAGNGRAAVQWAVPSEQALGGTRFFARWYVSDPSAPGGLAVSERIEFTLFGEHGTAPVAVPTPEPVPLPPAARLSGLSARVSAGGAAGPAIAGLVVEGAAGKRVVVRAVGPTLSAFGLSDGLGAPALELVRNGTVVGGNAGWLAVDAAVFSSVGAFALPAGSRDAALVATLPAGATTATVRGADGGTGIALLEVYDADATNSTSRLAALSARARVGTGAAVLIGGFTVQGEGTVNVLVRAVGPGLTQFGVGDALGDPQVTLYRASAVLASNDDWGAAANAAALPAAATSVGAFALAPGSRDSALMTSLSAGNYTAVVTGAGGATGTALLEIYVLP